MRITPEQNPTAAPQTTAPDYERAVLVAVCRDRQPMAQVEEYLAELEFLAETAHIVTERTFVQKLPTPDSRYFVGPGKLEEIRDWCEEHEDRKSVV